MSPDSSPNPSARTNLTASDAAEKYYRPSPAPSSTAPSSPALPSSTAPASPALRSEADSEKESYYQVVLDREEDPQSLPLYRKWLAVVIISTSAIVSTCASSAASFTEEPIASEFGVSEEVTILGISLYVLGLGFGPLIASPASEVVGRIPVYRAAFIVFFAFCWPVAFAPNIAVYFVFRFLTGFAAAAFLSVAGGSVGDMFNNDQVATPMAVYTISPFLGPELGPLYSGFVNQHLNWRWTYHIITIWVFIQTLALWFLVPETHRSVLEQHKAARLRKETGIDLYYAPVEHSDRTFKQLLLKSCTTPFILNFFEPMAQLINLWNSLILGIVYLAFQAFPIIFSDGHGFNKQSTGLAFLGILTGMLLGLSSQPYWNRRFRQYKKAYGDPPPEFRLVMGEVGGILVSIGLFWLAFTTYPSVHWIVPIIATVPFGAGVYYVYTSSFTYLVVAYRPVAASAMASNSAMRSSFAAAFPLFSTAMYHTLGTVGATALLAGLITLMAPLPFIFHSYGAQLRKRSRFAAA